MAEENIQQESEIQNLLAEIPQVWVDIKNAELRTKETLAMNWYRFGKKAAAIRDYWHSKYQSFSKNWTKAFPDIKKRRVEQAMMIATSGISEEKILKMAKIGFDNMYNFVSSLQKCTKENVKEILYKTSIMTTIKNYDDPLEEGLHRLKCFDNYMTIINQLDISKINIELLWDVLLANGAISDHAMQTIQTTIDKGENVDDYLKMIIQTGGGEPQPPAEDNLASINVSNSRFIEITKMYIDKNKVPEDFDLNRLSQSMTNCSQLMAIKEDNNVDS
jgi:hypothetical protein